jgi:endonuclease/exonuclease/phosphatase family metal-dependent hydrolase
MTPPSINVLTLNINFKGLDNNRAQNIVALIEQNNPDIIFLQEVPRSMIDNFRIPNYSQIGQHSSNHQYDTIILSRFPCIRYDRIPLPETLSNRNLLLAQIILPEDSQIIFAGTFHLESFFNPPESEVLKMDQFLFIQSIIPKNQPFIIAGDTNFLDNQMTSIDNFPERDSSPTYKKSRFDRIFTNLSASSPAQIIGDASHSDHRGLIINLISQ